MPVPFSSPQISYPGDTLTETSATSAGNWNLTETGADGITTVENGDSVNGGYTQTQSGSDTYTIAESGTLGSGAYSLTLTGTDAPTQTEIGNSIQGTFNRTVVGGGTYTRNEIGGTLGMGSSTNAYTLTITGNNLTGDYSQNETGSDRFGLIEQFDNIADTDGVTSPGHMQYRPFGAAFADDVTNDGNKFWQTKSGQELWAKIQVAVKILKERAASLIKQVEDLEKANNDFAKNNADSIKNFKARMQFIIDNADKLVINASGDMPGYQAQPDPQSFKVNFYILAFYNMVDKNGKTYEVPKGVETWSMPLEGHLGLIDSCAANESFRDL